MYFNPRSPRGGATLSITCFSALFIYFNPRSPRGGATLMCIYLYRRPAYFNPRSPRGGATNHARFIYQKNYISIHAPHEGERHYRGGLDRPFIIFQSTLPTRGSDQLNGPCICRCENFNPRSPRGGATLNAVYAQKVIAISIHAPHEGERRRHGRHRGGGDQISIHAPHEGERRTKNPSSCRIPKFQSTLPTRGSDEVII